MCKTGSEQAKVLQRLGSQVNFPTSQTQPNLSADCLQYVTKIVYFIGKIIFFKLQK